MLLYQFPFSHYCEKVAWLLDAKGIAHEVRNVPPGMHRVVARRKGLPGTVPMLIDGDNALGDSAQIAVYLEERYPERPLVPEGDAGQRVLELAAQFDGTYGVDSRQWIYGVMAESGGATRLWPPHYRGRARVFVNLTRRIIEGKLRRMYRVSADNTRAARARLDMHFAALGDLLDGRTDGYLVGGSLTLADITAAALLAPAVVPEESPWSRDELPESLVAARRELRATPAGAWIMERYRTDRRGVRC